MSKPKHTPGPWSLEIPPLSPVAYIRAYRVGGIAQVGTGNDDPAHDSPRVVADAHLIAAAPEMFEALLMLADVEGHLPTCAGHDLCTPRCSQVRAAISKARGES